MVEAGQIRIGTLRDYRKQELGAAISDAGEGTQKFFSRSTSAKTNPDDLNWLERSAVNIQGASIKEFVFSNNYVERRYHSPDLYLYCASIEFDLEIVERINAENRASGRSEYSACVQIDGVEDFAETVERFLALRKPVHLLRIARCDYRGRDFNWTQVHGVPIELLKPENYAYQKEGRVIFEPISQQRPLKPFVIEIPQIKKLCKVVWRMP